MHSGVKSYSIVSPILTVAVKARMSNTVTRISDPSRSFLLCFPRANSHKRLPKQIKMPKKRTMAKMPLMATKTSVFFRAEIARYINRTPEDRMGITATKDSTCRIVL